MNVTNPINTDGVSAVPGVDNRALGLKLYKNEVIAYFNEKSVALNLVTRDSISGGTSKQFIVSGNGGDALSHTPGTDITSNIMKVDERTISIKDRAYKSFFLDALDEKLSQWNSRGELVKQAVETINQKIDKELFTLVETAVSTAPVADQDAGSTITMAGYQALTDEEDKGKALLKGIYKLNTAFNEKRVPEEDRIFVTTAENYANLVLAKDAVNSDFNEKGNGGIDTGKVFKIAGVSIIWSNNLPVTANLEGLFFTPGAVGYLEAMGIDSEMNYDFKQLGDILTSYVAYGTGVLNPACSGALIGGA